MFIEIGTDADYVHLLVQSVPTYSPTRIVRTVKDEIKSLTTREIFQRVPSVKAKLWVGAFWSSGFFICSCGVNPAARTAQALKDCRKGEA